MIVTIIGNPWFITTLALAQLLVIYKKNNILYKLFNDIINEKTIENIIRIYIKYR